MQMHKITLKRNKMEKLDSFMHNIPQKWKSHIFKMW